MDLLGEIKRKQLLVEPAALEHLKKQEDPMKLLEACETHLNGGFMITHAIVDEVLNEWSSSQKTQQAFIEKNDFIPQSASIESRILFQEKPVAKVVGELNDFTKYFQNRFAQLSNILKARRSENVYATISKAKQMTDRGKIRIIGMVSDNRETKNGHRIIELEDENETIVCLASKNNAKIMSEAALVLADDTIALDGFTSNGLFIIENIVWPDLPLRSKKLIEDDVSIAFISDMHFGSKYFMQREFEKFIRFINCETDEREEASKIKYLLVAGDVVDGVGVYPSQEEQLTTKDIFKQYEMFCDYFEQIPEHIQVIISPGNHDAVRTAEPSPRLSPEFTQRLEGKKNFSFVSNPALVEVHGVKVLIYHGTSVDNMIKVLPNLQDGYENPHKVAVELLKRRHLSPVYGEKSLIPLHYDDMVISEVPDILHFGHVHKNGYTDYKGTFIVNSGTWQDRTDYQVKQGHHPSPGELPIYNLKTGALKIISFVEEHG
ncbi:DNA-directed DNA polymerase II small subunit [Candidatus Micrarchaeota archaeon]|nr:DNA-directed DNA polymerase II small subunit [Candidatus Micrarchaeota archaeon]